MFPNIRGDVVLRNPWPAQRQPDVSPPNPPCFRQEEYMRLDCRAVEGRATNLSNLQMKRHLKYHKQEHKGTVLCVSLTDSRGRPSLQHKTKDGF